MMHHDIQQRNAFTYLSHTFVRSIGTSMLPVTVLQSYMLGLGLGYDKLALYNTAGTVTVALMLFLLPGLADSVRRFSSFVRALFSILMLAAVTPLTLLVVRVCFPDLPANAVFWLLLAAYVVTAGIGNALTSTFDPKALVRLGLSGSGVVRLLGLVSLLSYAASVVSSFVVSFFTSSKTLDAYVWLSVLSTAVIAIGTSFVLLYRPGPQDSPTSAPRQLSPLRVCQHIFPMRQFRLLMAPNILRAIGDSVHAFIVPIGLVKFADDPAAVGLFTIASSVGGAFGGLFLTLLQKKSDVSKLYLVAATTIGVVLVVSCLTGSLALYTLAVGLASAGFLLYGSLPAAVTYKYVPADVIGSFTALRLFVLNLFSSAFGYLIGVVLEVDIPYLSLCIAALAAYVASGVLFRTACRKMDAAQES